MKNAVLLALCIALCLTAAAQKSSSRETLFGGAKEPIAAKYLTGAVPLTDDGKVQWDTVLVCSAVAPRVAYDRALAFLNSYCKEKGKTHKELQGFDSQMASSDTANLQVGARIHEDIVFQKKALSYDRAILSYSLLVDCRTAGECRVTMSRLSYTYEENRGGGTFAAETMLPDGVALNKAGDGFNRGGHRKFRTKTIDAKDSLFAKLAEAINAQ